MDIIFSGADEGPCLDAVRHCLNRNASATWSEPRSLLAALAAEDHPLPSACLVWIYRAPSAVARSEPAESGRMLVDVLDEWFQRNLAALNLRRREGLKIHFVNAERAPGIDVAPLVRSPAAAVGEILRATPDPARRGDDAIDLVAHLFRTIGMRFCEVFDSLEAAALLPGASPSADRPSPSEAQLVELLESLRGATEIAPLRRAQQELAQHLADAQGRLEATAARLDVANEAIAAAKKDAAAAVQRQSRRDEEYEVLQVQLHQLQEELESYYRNFKAMEAQLQKSATQYGDSQQQCAALREQLGVMEAALLEQMETTRREQSASSRVESLSTRQMASTVVRRVIGRFVPARVRRYRAQKRARQQSEQTLAPLRQSKWFDAAWYLRRYEDVSRAGLDPFEHYHAFGWKEGRDPGPEFSTRYYLESNRDVKQSGMDPLLHFIECGMNEGRRPRP